LMLFALVRHARHPEKMRLSAGSSASYASTF
jgi:hypothetical protein